MTNFEMMEARINNSPEFAVVVVPKETKQDSPVIIAFFGFLVIGIVTAVSALVITKATRQVRLYNSRWP